MERAVSSPLFQWLHILTSIYTTFLGLHLVLQDFHPLCDALECPLANSVLLREATLHSVTIHSYYIDVEASLYVIS